MRFQVLPLIMVFTLTAALAGPCVHAQQPAPPRTQAGASPSGGTGSAASPSAAAVTYEKVFKGSTPEYFEITVRQNGSGSYDIRQLEDQPNLQTFTTSPSLAARIFQLAMQLHDFDGISLDVQRRIAYLGQKMLRYEAGGEKHEVTYNYTLNVDATQLQQLFEGLGREQLDLQDLRRTMRYDRLGVTDVLERIEDDINTKSLAQPETLLPVLDELAADDRYMGIARQRARSLAESIRNPH
jgi:hypothetical protein